ncbi:hypothetical protein YC2023_016901 [Brassica napus]
MNTLFYFLLASTAVLATTANASEPVVDADGDLISDGSYYAVPVSDNEGGLTLGSGGGNQCPFYIGPELSTKNKGLALKFSNWGSWAEFVPESENLNIEMNVPPSTICGQSSYWWLTETQSKGLLFIAAGPKPETGKDSSKSFFQIKKAGDFLRGYKFVYCRNDKSCYEFGMVVDRFGYNRLAPANLPFLVDFVKADKTETSSKSKTDSFVKDYKEFVELEDKSFNLHNTTCHH